MPYICGILGIACFLFAWILEPYSYLTITLIAAGVFVCVPSRYELIPKSAHAICASIATGLAFYFFASFFLGVPALPADWYLRPLSNSMLGYLVGGFASLVVISENSCCLKLEKDVEDARKILDSMHDLRARLVSPRT